MSKFRWFWHHYYWGGTVYSIIESVDKNGIVKFSKLDRASRFLNWHARRKNRLIKHRWCKWQLKSTHDDDETIGLFECKKCHKWCYKYAPKNIRIKE